jgi:hypothetical protein
MLVRGFSATSSAAAALRDPSLRHPALYLAEQSYVMVCQVLPECNGMLLIDVCECAVSLCFSPTPVP